MANTLESASGAANISFQLNYRGTKPNFARDQFATVGEMNGYTICDVGHISYCLETDKYYRFNKNKQWEELIFGGDTSQLEQEIERIEQEIAGFSAQEVFQVETLPVASEDLMNKMYLVPVTDQDYFTEHIVTKKLKSSIDNVALKNAAGLSNIPTGLMPLCTTFEELVAAADIASYCLFNSSNSYFCVYGSEDENADSYDETDTTNHTGWNEYSIADDTIVYTKNNRREVICYKATSSGWVLATDIESFDWGWLQVGSTQWNVDSKQDKLTDTGGNVTVQIGTKNYVLTGAVEVPSSVTPPSLPGNSDNLVVNVGNSYKGIYVTNNADHGITYYKVALNQADAQAVTSSNNDGSTTASKRIDLSTTPSTPSKTYHIGAVTYQFGIASEPVTYGVYTVKQKLDQPSISLSADEYASTRTVTIKSTNNTAQLGGLTLNYKVNGEAQTAQTINANGSYSFTISTDGSSVTEVYLSKDGYIASDKAGVNNIRVNRPKIYYGLLRDDPADIMTSPSEYYKDDETPAISFMDYIQNLSVTAGDNYMSTVNSISDEGLTATFTIGDAYASNPHWYVIAIPKDQGYRLSAISGGPVDALSAFTMVEQEDYYIYYSETYTSSITYIFKK